MAEHISVIGGANFDISAALSNAFVAADSNPGHVSLGYGGVARNIAHNLLLLGHEVHFLSAFGGDIFGGLTYDRCKSIGLNLSMSMQIKEERTGIYLCINNHSGEMIAAVADTDIINNITPEYLQKHLGQLNQSEAIVLDTNLPEASIQFMLENSLAPVFVDTVSSAKAWKLLNALRNSKMPKLHTAKLNWKEASIVTESVTVEEAAQKLIDLGAEHVYITRSGEGVYCASAKQTAAYPALPGEIVNTTGAGDAFLAGVVHAKLQGISFPQTAQYGLMAARATLQSEQAVNPNIANILL